MAEFYEFFAGGGMVRRGLGPGWTCRFANDLDLRKCRAYRANFGAAELKVGDVRDVGLDDLPGVADLVWGSFPCQDLSLAGGGAGLRGQRSGTFYPFWDVITALVADGRAPRIIAVENVCGTLSSHDGEDFASICGALTKAGYRHGALIIDAELFVPQSRPRLFVIGVRSGVTIDPTLLCERPTAPFHTAGLRKAVERLPCPAQASLLWWKLTPPARRASALADHIEEAPRDVAWHEPAQTDRLLSMMSPLNLAKLGAAKRAGRRMVGGVYRRTRLTTEGGKAQRAEIRFDDVAGCLRTPGGGSSRQTIIVVDGASVRSRLISARETARLMGLSDDYVLPETYNDAYHLTGDGVVVDVVRHLAEHLFEPLLERSQRPGREPEGTPWRAEPDQYELPLERVPQEHERLRPERSSYLDREPF